MGLSRFGAAHGSGKVRSLYAIASLLFVFMVPGLAQAQTPVFFALIQPGQEVPPIASRNAFGNAFMTLDVSTAMPCYSISYAADGAPDLSSGEIFAHFHGPALPGVNAGVLFDISPMPPGPSLLGSPKVGCVGPVTGALLSDLIAGLWYINIHSNAFPGGEIRGQVIIQRVL